MSAPRPHGFVRSQLSHKLPDLLVKIEDLKVKKPNAFNVEFGSLRFPGLKMTAFDLTTDPTKVTFTFNAVNYEFLLTDIQIIQRMRSRKYLFKVKVLTTV